jgi:hypothetical protein
VFLVAEVERGDDGAGGSMQYHGIKIRDRTHLASILAAAASVPCEPRDQFLEDVASLLRPHAHREINERDVAVAIDWARQRVDG